MKTLLALLLFFTLAVLTIQAQDNGLDQQNENIRDRSSERAPASNGVNRNVGTGRGIDLGRRPAVPTLPNPYRFVARRDAVIKAVEELMIERKLLIDEAVSKIDNGIFISQPYTLIKGAVQSKSELNRIAQLQPTNGRGWTRGRYTVTIEVQALDANRTNVSVNARIEGRTDGATGAEWVTLPSNGTVEQGILAGLIEKITGAPPPGHLPSP